MFDSISGLRRQSPAALLSDPVHGRSLSADDPCPSASGMSQVPAAGHVWDELSVRLFARHSAMRRFVVRRAPHGEERPMFA